MKQLILLIMLLTACTSHTMTNVHNEQTFIAEMIPHHQEAVDTSKQILTTENTKIKQLAQEIITAQETEIQQMKQWLKQWHPQEYTPKYQNMMPKLTQPNTRERDKAYLQGMKHHHEMAIQMAKQAQKYELKPEVQQLTENIITTQQQEIQHITEILNEYD